MSDIAILARQANDVLAFTPIGNITGGYLNGTLTLTGSDTIANYQTALRSVTHVSSSQSSAARTVSFQVNAGSGVNNLSKVATRTRAPAAASTVTRS